MYGGHDVSNDDPLARSIVRLDNFCSGVALAPQVVLSAAHCGTPTRIWGTKSSKVVRCKVVAYSDRTARDLELCLTEDAVTEEIAILADPQWTTRRDDNLNTFTLYAAGASKLDGVMGEVRAAEMMVSQTVPITVLKAPGIGTCGGDSGGGIFLNGQLVGVLSSGSIGCRPGEAMASPLTFDTIEWLVQHGAQHSSPRTPPTVAAIAVPLTVAVLSLIAWMLGRTLVKALRKVRIAVECPLPRCAVVLKRQGTRRDGH